MKLARVGFALLLRISTVIAEHQNGLEYSLRTVEYLIEEHVGRFECVLLDISSQNAYDNILNDLLRAPRLEYVVKYVIQGEFRSSLFPKHPQLLVIHPGREADFVPFVKSVALNNFIDLFSPFTQVLIFMDLSESLVEYMIRLVLIYAKFNHVLFFDTTSTTVLLSSLKNCVEAKDDLPHPKYLFKWFKGQLLGSNITYAQERGGDSLHPSFKWITATAEYLKGEALEYRTTEGGPAEADVQLEQNVTYGVQPYFRTFIVTAPLMTRVLIPRGRALSEVELMLLPFEWHVWALLVIVLLSTVVFKHFNPDLLRNDPVLLVVCGFERHNLHRAGRWEKIILQSLIILMFFMTNAFETKIVSLMIDRPSAQPVRSLADFDKYGIKFRYNLTENAASVNHSTIGKYVNHGEPVHIWDNEPGFALYVTQSVIELIPKFSYDFERGQTWFIVLDDEVFFDGILIHRTAYRSEYLKVLKFTHVSLDEGGILNLWLRQARENLWLKILGARPRGKAVDEEFLTFGDMMLAWIVLGIGYGVGMFGFVGELARKRFV